MVSHVVLVFFETIFILVFGMGVSILWFKDSKAHEAIKQEVTLNPESAFFRTWSESNMTVSTFITIFNVTNSAAVQDGDDDTLLLDPVGPFVFTMIRKNIIMHSNDNVIDYQPRSYFYYDDTFKGNKPLDKDPVTIANAPLIAVQDVMSKQKYIFQRIVSLLATGTRSKPFTERLPDEILFKGYLDSFLEGLKVVTFLANEKKKIPTRFSFLAGKNGTNLDGNWTALTGSEGGNDVLTVVRWNSYKEMEYNFTTPGKGMSCKSLGGMDGSKYRAGLTGKETLFVFMPGDICTSLPFIYDSESNVKGIKTLRYRMRFDEASRSLSCYSPRGYLDTSPCKDGAPVFVSAPHFYGSDRKLLRGIKGLNPDKSLHESFMDVEPKTGLVMKVAIRIQINVNMSRESNFPTSNLQFPHRLVPILAVESLAEASQADADLLYYEIFERLDCITYVGYSLVAVGLISTLIAISQSSCYGNKRQKHRHLILYEDE